MPTSLIKEEFALSDHFYKDHTGLTNIRANHMHDECSPRYRVLCFSRDRLLGETRTLVLQRYYETVYVGSLEECAALSSGPAFDAVVLCHSLSYEEYEGCIEIAELLWPQARIVSVAAGSGSVQLESTAVVPGLAGPRALLFTLQQVLQPIRSGAGPN